MLLYSLYRLEKLRISDGSFMTPMVDLSHTPFGRICAPPVARRACYKRLHGLGKQTGLHALIVGTILTCEPIAVSGYFFKQWHVFNVGRVEESIMKKRCLLWGFCSTMILVSSCAAFAANPEIPRLLMLSQPLCPPCMSMEKVLEEIQSRYIVVIEDFNVREDMSVAERYGAKKTPFLVFFDKTGVQIGSNAGALSEEEILRVFQDGRAPLARR
jgi:thiol-disulfide isomerase/thioredoxin